MLYHPTMVCSCYQHNRRELSAEKPRSRAPRSREAERRVAVVLELGYCSYNMEITPTMDLALEGGRSEKIL